MNAKSKFILLLFQKSKFSAEALKLETSSFNSGLNFGKPHFFYFLINHCTQIKENKVSSKMNSSGINQLNISVKD